MSKSVEGLPLVVILTPVCSTTVCRFLRKRYSASRPRPVPNIVHVALKNARLDGSAEIIEKLRETRAEIQVFRNATLLPLQQNCNMAFYKVPAEARYVKLACEDDLARLDTIAKIVALAESDPSVEVLLCDDVFDGSVRRSWLLRSKLVHDGKDVARRILERTFGWPAFHHFFVRMHPEFNGGSFCGDVWAPDPYVVLRSAVCGKVGYIAEPLV